MSRKHRHRAENRPVTRRYVMRVVNRARDEILSAIIHGRQIDERDAEVVLMSLLDRPSLPRQRAN